MTQADKNCAVSRNSELKILVCCHKLCALPPLDDGILLPVHAGKAISAADLHIQGDNEVNGQPCDNISSKNETYAELTVIYWAWKNLKRLYPDVKYVGMSHYRRFFSFGDRDLPQRHIDELKHYRVDSEEAAKILESGKIIVPKKFRTGLPVGTAYCRSYMSCDYRAVKEVIRDDFPDYMAAFDEVFEWADNFYIANMFIMKYDDFTQYCEWLFSVLSKLDEKINAQSYELYQRRAPAFMAERLFKVWLIRNKKQTHSMCICLYYDLPAAAVKTVVENIFTKTARFIIKGAAYAADKMIMKLIVFRYKFIENLKHRL